MKIGIASAMALLLGAGMLLQIHVMTVNPAGLDDPAAHRTAPSNDGLLDIFYMGNRRSQIEPCGCQTKQRGGMQYEAALYHQHDNRPSIRVDAGEWTRPRIEMAPVQKLQNRTMLRAFQALELDAANVGLNELQLTKPFFDSMAKDHPGSLEALVSANVFLADDKDKHAFATERIVERKLAGGKTVKIGITGITAVSFDANDKGTEVSYGDFIVKEPLAAAAPVIEALRPKVDLLVVLYYSVSAEQLKAFNEAQPKVDVLVTNGMLPDPRAMSMREGRTLMLRTYNSLGKELGTVSVKPGEDGAWQTAGEAMPLYVALDLPIEPKVTALLDEFKEKTRELAVDIPSPYQIENIYAGAQSCAGCHTAIYADWAKTKHAHAMEALSNVGQDSNPECVKCHVTGFRKQNGFYSIIHGASLPMSNVQCEVCHGPSAKHVTFEQQILAGVVNWKTPEEYKQILDAAKANIPPAKVEMAVCIQCHQGDNDADFAADPAGMFAKKVLLVNHGAVPEAERNRYPAPPIPAKRMSTPPAPTAAPVPPSETTIESNPAPQVIAPVATPIMTTPFPDR